MLGKTRYSLKQMEDGSWSVIDTETGQTARFNGSLANDFMDRDEAEEVALKLNFIATPLKRGSRSIAS
ncbi:hypothetical protein ABK249_02665 [Neorhizobium sp. Rsf11]|uniref:Uncharacterized protein n=1 Tax=Neorhizobium phenanthreniclasticum TaxID=3157917 RepID=A0ABV0LW52_9HYPH